MYNFCIFLCVFLICFDKSTKTDSELPVARITDEDEFSGHINVITVIKALLDLNVSIR